MGWQRLSDHLEAVSRLAGQLAGQARPGDRRFTELARLGGRLHDYGKYSDCFQRMLTTGKGSCRHAIHGASIACRGLQAEERERPLLNDVGAAVYGHHAGLPDLRGEKALG